MYRADLTGARWRKSSRSGNGGDGTCVEVAGLRKVAAVRDSKNVPGPVLTFSNSAWQAFVAVLR